MVISDVTDSKLYWLSPEKKNPEVGALFRNEAVLKSFFAWLHFYLKRCEFYVYKIKVRR